MPLSAAERAVVVERRAERGCGAAGGLLERATNGVVHKRHVTRPTAWTIWLSPWASKTPAFSIVVPAVCASQISPAVHSSAPRFSSVRPPSSVTVPVIDALARALNQRPTRIALRPTRPTKRARHRQRPQTTKHTTRLRQNTRRWYRHTRPIRNRHRRARELDPAGQAGAAGERVAPTGEGDRRANSGAAEVARRAPRIVTSGKTERALSAANEPSLSNATPSVVCVAAGGLLERATNGVVHKRHATRVPTVWRSGCRPGRQTPPRSRSSCPRSAPADFARRRPSVPRFSSVRPPSSTTVPRDRRARRSQSASDPHRPATHPTNEQTDTANVPRPPSTPADCVNTRRWYGTLARSEIATDPPRVDPAGQAGAAGERVARRRRRPTCQQRSPPKLPVALPPSSPAVRLSVPLSAANEPSLSNADAERGRGAAGGLLNVPPTALCTSGTPPAAAWQIWLSLGVKHARVLDRRARGLRQQDIAPPSTRACRDLKRAPAVQHHVAVIDALAALSISVRPASPAAHRPNKRARHRQRPQTTKHTSRLRQNTRRAGRVEREHPAGQTRRGRRVARARRDLHRPASNPERARPSDTRRRRQLIRLLPKLHNTRLPAGVYAPALDSSTVTTSRAPTHPKKRPS